MRLNEARCILLASLMKADKVVFLEELDLGRHISEVCARVDNRADREDWVAAVRQSDRVEEALARLRQEWLAEREDTIDYLWHMASSDGELHPAEAYLIVEFAKKLMVEPNSRVTKPTKALLSEPD